MTKRSTRRTSELESLRKQAARIYAQLLDVEAKMEKAGAKWSADEVRELNDLGKIKDRGERLNLLDKSMKEELEDLRRKLEEPNPQPRPPQIWEVLREILAILDKIFKKLIELQRWLPPPGPPPTSRQNRAGTRS